MPRGALGHLAVLLMGNSDTQESMCQAVAMAVITHVKSYELLHGLIEKL